MLPTPSTCRTYFPFLTLVVLSGIFLVQNGDTSHARSADSIGIGTNARAPRRETALPDERTSGPHIYLGESLKLPVSYMGDAYAIECLTSGNARSLSMTAEDLDRDGVDDLAIGYGTSHGGIIAAHRGNPDAFAPQSREAFEAIGKGEFPFPFLPEAAVIPVPVRPDFIAVGSFNPDGYRDLIIAERSDTSIYLLSNDGMGNFSPAKAIDVGKPITTLAVGDFGKSAAYSKLLVGVSDRKTSSLLVYEGSFNGLGGRSDFKLQAPATSLVLDQLSTQRDAYFISNGRVRVLRSLTLKLETVSPTSTVAAFALGSFISDRNAAEQIAFLRSDGGVDIEAHTEFDPRAFTTVEMSANRRAALDGRSKRITPIYSTDKHRWKVVEHLDGGTAFGVSERPIFFRTRISDNGNDDLIIIGQSNGKLKVISHPDGRPGDQTFLRAQISTRPYSGSVAAALTLRVNVDGRPGVVALNNGEADPSVMMPLPDPTFTVNRTDDPTPHNPITGACNGVANDCSLREAILRSNANAGTDTVMVPAGTFTLTRAKVTNDFSGNNGALYVNDSVNIVGAGQNSTIIQAGTVAYNAGAANGVDLVMAVNEDINPLTNATASISSLTIQNGHNRGAHGNDGDGGCMEFDTGTSGNANLTLTNVTLQNCDTTQGEAGGIALFNFLHPTTGLGLATFTNSIIQGNSASDSTGGVAAAAGGIWVSNRAAMSMTGSQVLNNKATQVTPTLPSGAIGGFGGGIYLFSDGNASRQSVIHSSNISGNQASSEGGGIYNSVNLLVDQGSVISNNSAGSPGVTRVEGGGVLDSTATTGCPAACSETATFNKVSITGNTASNGGSGGGIYHGNDTGAGSLSVTFSRLAGNTAQVSGSNLFENHSVANMTDNWWGTNAPLGTITNSGGAVTFDPFIVLTQSAMPSKIRISQSTAVTADMTKDNHGNGAALTGNLDEITGLAITFNNPLLGTIPQAQPETLGNPVPTATATFNAGGTSGRGSDNATVDQAVVGANSNSIATATEAGTTVTITTVGVHNFSANNTIVISGVGVAGYNGTFTILSTPTPTTFTYTASVSGLSASSGGSAAMGIIILSPPQITKTFGAASIPINGTTTVNFSINNPNVVAINESFTDTLPAGLQVAATTGLTNTCGGTVTATAGSGTISFSNNLAPIGACSISVNVTGTVDNNYINSVSIISTDAGNGNTSTANITVINPPHIVKTFGAATIPLNGSTSLTFTIDSNANQNLTITGVGFIDSLPAGLVVANPTNIGGTCTGTVTAVAGASTISLSGQSIAANANCTLSVDVKGTTAGVKSDSVQVTSTSAGTGNTATASITVLAPPTISKGFGAGSIAVNASTSLSFTLNNPNTTVDLTGVAFTDTLPTGLVISTPNGLTGSCGSGTIVATAGSGLVSLSGGTIAASGSCTFSANVTGASPGTKNNTTGNVTSANGGTGLTASASVTVNKANTTASITSDTPDPSVVGQPVVVNFHVASATGSSPTAPSGNVTVGDGTDNCTGSIDGSGDGSCNISFASAGSKSLTASYAGDSNFNASPASASAPHTVNKGDVTVVVSSDQDPSITGQNVTFTATISAISPAIGTPSGTIQFKDGATNIGSAQSIVGGMASVSTSTLTAGTHTITGQYSSDTNFNVGSGTLSGGQVVSGAAEWTGSVDSDWNNPANWSTGVVPASSNSADIPATGVTNDPVIGGLADVTLVDLTIGSGRSLTVNGGRTLTIDGVLTMNGNDIDATTGLVSIADTGSIARTSGIVLGTLQKAFSAPELFTYPVGTTGAFSPVDVNVTNGPGTLSVLAHTGTAPATPPLDASKMLQRYWTLNGSGITTDITFHYLDPMDVPATSTESQYRVFRIISGGTALAFDPDGTNVIVNAAADSFSVTSIRNFSDWTAGNPLAPTAALVGISGRVTTALGTPINKAKITLMDQNGNLAIALTNPFGYYHFDGVRSGETYVLSVMSKYGTFSPRAISVNDEIMNFDFVAH